MDQEIPTPGLAVKFLVSIEDVTAKVLKGIDFKMDEATRQKQIEAVSKTLADEASKGTNYKVDVKPIFEGNQYILLKYEIFTDVRMVGTPPSSIGKFGGDTDNWMWPRHTGDFSMFRVYANKDNHPAAYSAENVPYKPKKHLSVSIKGVKEGDFSMIMGNPGSTDRYATSWEVKMTMDVTNDYRAKIRGIRQDILKADMKADSKVRIMYASKYARSANYWKYSIEQNKALLNLDVIGKKKQIEAEFDNWLAADASRKEKYGETMGLIQTAVKNITPLEKVKLFVREGFWLSTEIVQVGYSAHNITDDFGKLSEAKQQRVLAGLDDFYKDYNIATDKKIMHAMVDLYRAEITPEFQPDVFVAAEKEFGGDLHKWVEALYSKSEFRSLETAKALIASGDLEKIKSDPAIVATNSIMSVYFSISDKTAADEINLEKGRRLFQDAFAQLYPSKPIYPDANFTMRMTYGKVGGYSTKDAFEYRYYTTLDGVMQKEDATNPEFVVEPKLKQLYAAKDFGPYAQANERTGEMQIRTCFLTNHDITGGNSGSPVIDGKGNLIGLAFDGNSDAMSGDILFDKNLQRTISVDIRYVLFIIDKFAGDKRLIDEMTIVK
jgi:hypothetical protein